MFAVNGCWKRNSFSTSLVAAVKVAAGAAAVVDIHDCLNVSIDDASGDSTCWQYSIRHKQVGIKRKNIRNGEY
jgi:hypothetical protein